MSLSPVQFAKEFARLKSDLAGQSSDDLRLLLLLDFSDKLVPLKDKAEFTSYIDELAGSQHADTT